ncbi:MAG: NhaP-type Na+/H+ and K+/H+ antiporter, partial [Saprospiraceae bacterium]
MNKAERADLIQVLQDSEANLLSTLKQTNEDLFQFKPDSDTWSMAELVEHLAITDQTLLAALLKKGERLYEET